MSGPWISAKQWLSVGEVSNMVCFMLQQAVALSNIDWHGEKEEGPLEGWSKVQVRADDLDKGPGSG